MFKPLVLLPVLFWVAGGTAAAEPNAARMFRVGVLILGASNLITPQVKGLLDGLEEAGYIEGKTLIVDLLHENTEDKLRERIRAYLQQKVDVLVGTSGAETAIAKQLTDKIPIVFMPGSDPIRSGFVKSLARPETNLTGLTFYTDFDDLGKQLEMFKQVVPALRRVIVFYDGRRENPTQADGLQALRAAAVQLRLKLTEKSAHSITEAEQSLAGMRPNPGTGVFLLCGPLFKVLKTIASIAISRKMPLFGCSASQVAEERVSLTYAPDLYYIGYRGASYVDRIVRGAKPQYLPVETPTKFELVINRAALKEIKLNVPPDVLILADRVIN